MRNNTIDFFRRLAALQVILIHTAFHSGSSYVPAWFQNLTLFVYVPVFFFLSGWSATYCKD